MAEDRAYWFDVVFLLKSPRLFPVLTRHPS